MSLKAETHTLLNRLSLLEWFHTCGDTIDVSNRTISSWLDASKMCVKRHAENMQLEAKNWLTMYLYIHAKSRFQRWNKIVGEIKPYADNILDEGVVLNLRKFKITKGVRGYIYLDILGACMELEYADITRPKYFAERAEWYLKGHFPCGWEGEFPDGGLIIF